MPYSIGATRVLLTWFRPRICPGYCVSASWSSGLLFKMLRCLTPVHRGVSFAGVSSLPKEQANRGNPSVGRPGKLRLEWFFQICSLRYYVKPLSAFDSLLPT
jgi:hypothetical protein